MEAKPKQAAREELRYESMMQRVPHGIRALLSHGALPGSPGAEFANGLKARWDKAQALGWTRTEFDNRSEADLDSAILIKETDELAATTVTAILTGADGGTPNRLARGKDTTTRARIEEFLRAAGIHNTAGRITKTHFWKLGGYTNDRQFRKFQGETTDCSTQARETFNRILDAGPAEFVKNLRIKHLLP